MSGTTLLLGGGDGDLDTIEAAKRVSDRVVVTDKNESAPGLELADIGEPADITDTKRTIAIASQYDVDAVVPTNDYGVRTAADVAAELGIPGLTPDVASVCTDKAAMRRRWETAGLPQPEFLVSESWDQIETFLKRQGFPAIFKPANSCGGGSRGVMLVESFAEAKTAFSSARDVYDDDSRVLVEDCLVGSEHTVELLVENGRPYVLAMSDRELLPPPYRVDKAQLYPTDSEYADAIASLAKEAVEALGITLGGVHLEATVTDNGPALIELGARGGGGPIMEPIVRLASGVDYVENIVRVHRGESPTQTNPARTDGVVCYYLTPDGSGSITAVDGADAVRSWDGVVRCRLWRSEGDTVPETLQEGTDRSGTIVTHRNTAKQAYDLAQKAERNITFQTSE